MKPRKQYAPEGRHSEAAFAGEGVHLQLCDEVDSSRRSPTAGGRNSFAPLPSSGACIPLMRVAPIPWASLPTWSWAERLPCLGT
jgi:hypothetical protein